MSNIDVIKRKAFDKLDVLLQSALQQWMNTKDDASLQIDAENGDFTEEEYREIISHIESINLDKRLFISSCIYRGLDVPQDLKPRRGQ